MFVDASVVVAVLNRELEWEGLVAKLRHSGQLHVSPIVRFEAVLAASRGSMKTRRSPSAIKTAAEIVEMFFQDLGIEEVSITPEIGRGAISAASVYGKAVGHPADLNFGDCFSYACAKSLALPLLYKGHDFAKTDLA